MRLHSRSFLAIAGLLALIASVLVVTASAASAAPTDDNPAGFSCVVSALEGTDSERVGVELDGTGLPVSLRRVTATGSEFVFLTRVDLNSFFPNGPLGYLIRYRQDGNVFDVPCDSDFDPLPRVTCVASDIGNGLSRVDFDRDDFIGQVFFRRTAAEGSTFLTTNAFPDDTFENVAGDPEGIFIRYRVGDRPNVDGERIVLDVPCSVGDATPPQPVGCEYINIGGDEIVLLPSGPTDDLALHVRARTDAGSSFVATTTRFNEITVASGDYFLRYRVAGQVFEVDCLQQPF